jgi:predicted CxxxxCH...CXXCH cytochrome family protein
VACAICHKVDGAGAGPDPNAPSCFSSSFNGVSCHVGGPGGPNHPVPPARFTGTEHTSATSLTFPGTCGACHFETGAATKIGPTCTVCHQAGSPLTALSCTSCHEDPPNSLAPAGAAYPNIEGAHAEHIALTSAGTPISCDTCHSGLGTTTNAHYDRANARTGTLRVEPGDVPSPFPAGFLYTGITGNAVTFNSTLTSLTCSNVSCHGALVTPNWRTGATACTSCHNSATVAPAFYTDYTQAFMSHNTHINNRGIPCTTCHTVLPAGSHFGTLSDKSIAPRAAAATIDPNFGYPSPPPEVLNKANCNTGCHD